MRKIEYSPNHVSLATVCDSLNEASAEIDTLTFDADKARSQIATLRREIDQLHVSLKVLADLLAERGAIDFETLTARLAEAHAGERTSTATDVECVHCHERVAVAKTFVTPRGPICDACYVPDARAASTKAAR